MTLCLSFEKTFVRSTLSVYLFVMCFISQKKNTKCFVLTLRDISERTSVISFRNKREIHIASHRIACIKRKKKKKQKWMMVWEWWERWCELNKVRIERIWRICELNINARENSFKINRDCVEHDENCQIVGNNCKPQVQIDFYCTTNFFFFFFSITLPINLVGNEARTSNP